MTDETPSSWGPPCSPRRDSRAAMGHSPRCVAAHAIVSPAGYEKRRPASTDPAPFGK